MRANTIPLTIVCAQSAVQTLPRPAVRVEGGQFLNTGAASGSPTLGTKLVPVATTGPASTGIGFVGSPTSATTNVYLSATATAGELLTVDVVPIGGLPAA